MINNLLKQIELEENLLMLYEHQLNQLTDKTYTEYNIQYHKAVLEQLTNEIARIYSTVDME